MPDIDPTTLIESLNVEQLRAELRALDRRQSALRVLLRAALARRRDEQQGCQSAAQQQEASTDA
jgi:hypothetical protein